MTHKDVSESMISPRFTHSYNRTRVERRRAGVQNSRNRRQSHFLVVFPSFDERVGEFAPLGVVLDHVHQVGVVATPGGHKTHQNLKPTTSVDVVSNPPPPPTPQLLNRSGVREKDVR